MTVNIVSTFLAAGLLLIVLSGIFIAQNGCAPQNNVLFKQPEQMHLASPHSSHMKDHRSRLGAPGPYPQPSHEALTAAGCVAVSMQYVPSPLEAAQMRDCDQDHCLVERLPGAKEAKEQLLLLLLAQQAPEASRSSEVPKSFHAKRCDERRRYFYFNLGASTYPDLSQTWMHHAYAARGIHFDRIFMWEAASMDTQALFKSVPDEVYAAYQYFHEPVTADPASKRNPLHLIRTLTRPEDFVAFKLDIDTPHIEAHFVEQILQDPEVYRRIDELFWEIHFNEPGMVGCCWGQSTDSSVNRCTAMRTFLELRKRGIRAHAWP